VPDAALRALVDNHRAFLRFLERRLGDRALAEDVLQEAFARGLEKGSKPREEARASGAPGSALIAWFYRALANAAIDVKRRRGAANRALERFAHEIVDDEEPAHKVVCACIGKLATTLKPEYADALQRVEVEGASVKDYASERGITPNSAAVRVFRARAALKKKLTASCGTCAKHGCVDCSC
jgi:RNA polymerase sigma-70 factor (ECF subfamily)